MFYETLQDKFRTLLESRGLLDREIQVEARILKPTEAIGTPDRQDYPLLKGKEVLMQASFGESKGQAFTDAPSEFRGPLREVLDRGLEVKWTSFCRVDTVTKEILQQMRRAGCTTVSFGVESGSPEMLRRIKKGITLKQVETAMRRCLASGIEAHASFILGLPGETPETMQQTLAFGEKLKAMGVNHGFHILAPFPGTDIRESVEKYDLEILSDD